MGMRRTVRIVAILALIASSFMSLNVQATQVPDQSAYAVVPDQILVGFQPGVDQTTAQNIHAALGAQVVHNVYGSEVQLVQVGKGQAAATMATYAKNPNVRFA